MSQSEGLIIIITSIVTIFIMSFIDKKFKFSELLSKTLNINKGSDAVVFTVVVALIVFVVLIFLLGTDYYMKSIIAGLTLGILNGISIGINNKFIRKRNI